MAPFAPWRACPVWFAAPLLAAACIAAGPREAVVMADLGDAFSAAVVAQSVNYVESRRRLLAEPEAAARLMAAELRKRSAERHWPRRLVAAAVLSWIREPQLCDKVGRLMRGALTDRPQPPRPLAGQWSAVKRGNAIAALGKRATPRVLEIIFKTQEFSNAKEEQTLFIALQRLGDERAVAPLIGLLTESPTARSAGYAAQALGQTGDPRAGAPLAAIAGDRQQAAVLRATAARALGALGGPAALDPLSKIIRAPDDHREVREEAIAALGALGHPQAEPALLEALQTEHDPELLQEILGALAQTGGRASLPAVEKLARDHPDALVREEAAAAVADITERF